MFLVLLFVTGSAVLTSSLPAFQNCSNAGWTCENLEDYYNEHIIFTCSVETGMEVVVDLEEEIFNRYTTEVTVQNCTVVNLTLSQFERSEPLRTITMLNIKTLWLMETSTKSHNFTNPQRIILHNIESLPVIPAHTFTAFSELAADLIEIKNVTIGKIEQNAFDVLDASLTISNAVVDLVDTKAINILNKDDASVTIVNSLFFTVESNAFKFFSPQVKIYKNDFKREFREQSLVVNAELFLFYSNNVNIVSKNAFNITAQNITFVSNRFEHVASEAFDEVHPDLDDPESFFYQFRENEINVAEQFAFLHGWESYMSSKTLLIRDNHFNCTCPPSNVKHLLFDDSKDEIPNTDFYRLFLEEDSNTCMNTYCRLPLRGLKFAFNESRSYNNYISLEELNSFCPLIITENSQSGSMFLKTNFVLLVVSATIVMITRL